MIKKGNGVVLKFSVYTLGCKVNQYESQAISEQLEALGLSQAQKGEKAQVCVINTCTVTSESDRKSRQTVRRAIMENKGAFVVVTGCSSQIDPEGFKKIAGVHAVVSNKCKNGAVEAIRSFIEGNFDKEEWDSVGASSMEDAPYEPMNISRSERTRAYVKIEDGCESRCAYCIIPRARGKIRSRPIDQVLEEVRDLVKNGYKEIVLTGIEISAYGKGCDFDLCDLLMALDAPEFSALERVRLGSLDPSFLTEKTVDRLNKCQKLAHHFHLSLQSGSDRILALMRRKYNTKMVVSRVEYMRSVMKDVCFTAGIIVGFPSETEEDVRITAEFLEKISLLHCHLFCYSIRPGTEAATMSGQIPQNVKTQRLHYLSAGVKKSAHDVLSSFVGRELEVLFEEYENGCAIGHTSFFAKVGVRSGCDLHSEIFKVRISGVKDDLLIGEIIV